MALYDEIDFSVLVNEVERIVIDEMEKQMQKEEFKDVCFCEDCVLDMVGLALNSLKPSYRVSLLGSIYAKSLSDKEYSELQTVVESSIKKISLNPSHG